MTYSNLHTAVLSLGRKLYTFAGHHIDPTHTSFCFDRMARGIDFINREPATKTVNFDGEVYVEGKTIPVVITVAGTNIDQMVDVTIQIA